MLRFGGIRSRRSRGEDLRLPTPQPRKAGVYVDIENLNNAAHARAVIQAVVRNWPEGLPPVGGLSLYAPADKAGLWGIWAPARFPGLDVRVRGIQRFTRQSKNSADMAIVADAVADFTTGVARHIAVVSNDSDFGALFVKIQELASLSDRTEQPPFLWINLAGGSGLSEEIRGFLPEQLRWVVGSPPGPNSEAASKPSVGNGADLPAHPIIVRWLLREIPPGRFRAEDVRKIIQRHCPHHPAAQTTGVCGVFLARQLLPLLTDKGVTVVARAQGPTSSPLTNVLVPRGYPGISRNRGRGRPHGASRREPVNGEDVAGSLVGRRGGQFSRASGLAGSGQVSSMSHSSPRTGRSGDISRCVVWLHSGSEPAKKC